MTRNKEFDFTFQHFDTLRKLVHEYCGIYSSDDKYEMYYARLAKRLRGLKMASFVEYIARVKSDKQEFVEFVNAITTNVTAFEREPHHFEHLKSLVSSWPGKTLNIWSAGCSTGQEPYSILVNILPICERRGIQPRLLATDLDTDVLMKAQQAVYPLQAIEKYSNDIKRRYFLKGKADKSGFCRVKPRVVEHIEFRQLNLIYPWQLPRSFDCIFCRNVLIYFEADKKSEIISRFHASLVPEGTLFLGHSESIGRQDVRWRTVGKNIYHRVEA